MKKLLLFALIAGTTLASCKKDDDNGGGSGGNAALLTNGKWKITSSTSIVSYPAPIGDQTTDLFALFPACQQDNLYIFNANNTATTDEGATKCDASAPQQKTAGTWTLSGSQLTANDGTNTVTSDILTLNSTNLTLKYATNFGGIPAVTTTAYVKVP